jgi:putative membrane protein
MSVKPVKLKLIGIIYHDIETFTDLDFCLCSIAMNETQDSSTDPRIYMAAERTFLAWIRTGIAFMGFGFVVARFGLFLREIALANNMTGAQHNNGFSMPVGIALIVAGILVNLIAAIQHHRYIKALDRGQFRQAYGSAFIFLIAGFLAVIGLAVAIYLAVLL